MPVSSEELRRLLSQGPATTRQLTEKLGVSQPTLSRALKKLGDEIVRTGAGPSIQNTLRDNHRGFSAAPIYRITEEGQVKKLGELIPVYPDGFVMVQTNNASIHSDGLPWWLFDMRPQGYLGRALATVWAPRLGLDTNPEQWADADVVRALLMYGHDATGNLLIGERARAHFLEMPVPTPVERATMFPVLAKAAGAGETPGSSAGGEQPKFCTFTERGHVLVKFSAPDDNPVSERWRDLLLAEHLALGVLGVQTEVFDFAGQRFLEIPRFDRVGQLGRVGVISLRALDAEFVGKASSPWPVLVENLVNAGYVHPEALPATARLWAFGKLTGNTDMHNGNLSFVSSHGRPYQLAPAYDVLPMGFAPKAGGALANELRPVALSDVVTADTWREALALAEKFLAEARCCAGFSANFAPCIAALHHHIGEAKERIARLG